eukprot:g13646.t1
MAMQSAPVMAPASPWPTTGGDGMQQGMPQQVQQVVPAMASVQMAPAAMRQTGMVMPMQTMNWMPSGAPPFAIPAPAVSYNDGSAPSSIQPCYNAACPWPVVYSADLA